MHFALGDMSLRPSNVPRFVSVRGTMISTNRRNPSMLSIQAVRTLGLPNKDGILVVDNALLSVTFLDDWRISVWADVENVATVSTHEPGWLEACVVM